MYDLTVDGAIADERTVSLGFLQGHRAHAEFRGPQNLREVLLHVLGETAVHAGHLDAVRELLDGRQWMAF